MSYVEEPLFDLTPIVDLMPRTYLDRCQILREVLGNEVWNDTTGTYTPDADAVLYTGLCALTSTTVTEAVQGGLVTETQSFVSVPLSAPEVKQGDYVVMTHCRIADLVGKTFKVDSQIIGTYAVQRRLKVHRVDPIR